MHCFINPVVRHRMYIVHFACFLTVCLVGRTRWDGPGINSVWFRGEVEPGRPPREYSREMRGHPCPPKISRTGSVLVGTSERRRCRTQTRSRRGAAPDAEKRRERSHVLELFLYRSRRASPVALPRTAVPGPGELQWRRRGRSRPGHGAEEARRGRHRRASSGGRPYRRRVSSNPTGGGGSWCHAEEARGSPRPGSGGGGAGLPCCKSPAGNLRLGPAVSRWRASRTCCAFARRSRGRLRGKLRKG